MQRTKWILLIMILWVTACQEDESSNLISKEEESVTPKSNLRSSTLVGEGNLTGWFDQVSFFQGGNGVSNIQLQGQVEHQGSRQLLVYSNLYQNVEGVWEKVLTTNLFPTESEGGESGFKYSLALPEDFKEVMNAGGGYKLTTFIRSASDQKDELAMKPFYSGNRKTHSQEAQALSNTKTQSQCSGLRSGIDLVGGNFENFRLAGWVCRCGVNSNNIYVYATLRLSFLDTFYSPKFKANLASEQAVRDACNTNLNHRFDDTFSISEISLATTVNSVPVSIYAEERDNFFGPAYNATLIGTQDCVFDVSNVTWWCTPT